MPFYTNPIAQTGSTGNLKYTYSYQASSTTITDPLGKKVTENYDGGTLHSVVDQAGFSTTYTWDNYFNLAQVKDQRGNVSVFAYDPYGNQIKSQNARQVAAGLSKQPTYNTWNDVLTTKDTRGAVTQYVRDPVKGWVTSIVDPLGQTQVTYTYKSHGDVASIATAGTTTTVNYDDFSRIGSVVTPDHTYSVTYYTGSTNHLGTAPDAIAQITDEQGRTSTYNYDYRGRQTSVIRSDGASMSMSMMLDEMDRATAVIDWLGHRTSHTYDAMGRPASTLSFGGTTNFRYVDLTHVAGIQDPMGNWRQYGYTARGEVKSLQLPDGTSEQYQYDAAGNQTGRLNALYQVTH